MLSLAYPNTKPDIRKTKVTPRVPRGLVWMSFHFRDTCANWLTNPAFDPATLTAE